MIRVRKRPAPPPYLADHAPTATESLKIAYESNPAGYADGSKAFDFDGRLYGHPSVKQALIEDQHAKCCYCEGKPLSLDHGDVEHFRPKAGHVQADGEPIRRPGYYWLAYEWANLLFSCAKCNQSYKRSHFPLLDPARRAAHHGHDLAAEEPALVDPVNEEPAEHIVFREEYAVPADGSRKGRTTITILGLNREPLANDRRTWLERLRMIIALARSPGPEAPRAMALLSKVIRDDAEYAAMARCYLSARGN